MAPVLRGLAGTPGLAVDVAHTGQHYDHALSGSFVELLGMREPDHQLDVGSGSHAAQTAAAMVGIEQTLSASPFDALICAGDVNSTLAAALAAVKLRVPVVHVESGLRSGDWTMPEEVNRVLTDRISSLLLCHCQDAVDNLAAEGITGPQVALVGNTMIDTLVALRGQARERNAAGRLGLSSKAFVLVTLHRPALVDDMSSLAGVIGALARLARELPVVFPTHPRTAERLRAAAPPGLDELVVLEPLDYLDFLSLEDDARLVITDSGGVQEETSVLGVPCFTYRDSTERPVTVSLGTNKLVGTVPEDLLAACLIELERGPRARAPGPIPLWDGNAGERAAVEIASFVDGLPHSDRLGLRRYDTEPVPADRA
jgi:UDP-N-acetylglucosamine 2-epimerase (non-hydrolysing)